MEVDERELRNRKPQLEPVPSHYYSPRSKRGRQDPSQEAMPNNVKTANDLHAERNEATNSLHEENLPRSTLKGERQRQSPQG